MRFVFSSSDGGEQIFVAVQVDAPVCYVEDGETEREESARYTVDGDGPGAAQLLQVERGRHGRAAASVWWLVLPARRRR